MHKGTNQTHERRARNKKAFDKVIEAYLMMRDSSEIKAMDMSKNSSVTTNVATPLPIDFCCDVDYALNCIIKDKKELKKFYKTYILCTSDEFTMKEKAHLEQRVGQIFASRKIWPVNKYFLIIKKRVDNNGKHARK